MERAVDSFKGALEMNRLFSLLFVLTCLSGCTATLGAVNPRPNVVIGRGVSTISLDASKVADEQEPKGQATPGTFNMWSVKIKDFRTTLDNGFRNAVGSHFSSDPSARTRLVIDTADLEFSNLGGLGRFMTIRYRAHWNDAKGELLAEVAGTAQPTNPTETGQRHLEDVVEVMYEKMIDGLDKASGKR
jgi:hypothetical protein